MSSQRKNILVGVTVLGALAVLGWMIVQFGGTLGTLAAGSTYQVRMDVPRVEGLAEGNQVRYLGTTVGRVETINLNEDRTGFHLTLAMKPEINLPANVHGVIRATNLISGGAAIDLELDDPATGGASATADSPTATATRAASDRPVAVGTLQKIADDKVLTGTFAGADLIPPEFAQLAKQANDLLAEVRRADLIGNINAQVTRLGQVADNVNATIGDEQFKGDLKATLADARQTAASAAEAAKQVQSLARQFDGLPADLRRTLDATGTNVNAATVQLTNSLVQLDRVLADARQITGKINDGKGTAGALLNDDRLYREFIDSARLLEENLKTLNRLTSQWEEEGVKLRL